MSIRAVEGDDDWIAHAEPIRTAGLRTDAAELQRRLDEALRPSEVPAAPLEDLPEVMARLDADSALLLRGLGTEEGAPGARGVARDVALELLLAANELRPRLIAERDELQARSFGRIRDAIGLLQGISTIDRLIERAPMAAARLGPDRAFVSSIDDSCFVPRACFIRDDPEWAEAIVQAGQREPRRLDRHLLETEMVRRRQPIRVQDAQRTRGVHPEIAAVSMSRSYVAAPVVVRDRVVGFLHADYYEQRRLVSASDATNLWMFADAFGMAFERVLLGEQIGELRTSMQRLLAGVEGRFEAIAGREPTLRPRDAEEETPAGRGGHLRPVRHPDDWNAHAAPDEILTRRELEVLRLMAEGATNDGIATRLVISHGTAKTHVKHILRKLKAANRAEAVSRYFQREREREASAATEAATGPGAR